MEIIIEFHAAEIGVEPATVVFFEGREGKRTAERV
jgi:hypothetical protein